MQDSDEDEPDYLSVQRVMPDGKVTDARRVEKARMTTSDGNYVDIWRCECREDTAWGCPCRHVIQVLAKKGLRLDSMPDNVLAFYVHSRWVSEILTLNGTMPVAVWDPDGLVDPGPSASRDDLGPGDEASAAQWSSLMHRGTEPKTMTMTRAARYNDMNSLCTQLLNLAATGHIEFAKVAHEQLTLLVAAGDSSLRGEIDAGDLLALSGQGLQALVRKLVSGRTHVTHSGARDSTTKTNAISTSFGARGRKNANGSVAKDPKAPTVVKTPGRKSGRKKQQYERRQSVGSYKCGLCGSRGMCDARRCRALADMNLFLYKPTKSRAGNGNAEMTELIDRIVNAVPSLDVTKNSSSKTAEGSHIRRG